MQTNHHYGAVIGFLIFIILGAVILGVFVSGAFDPEKQAIINLKNAETDYIRARHAQELAVSQAETDAAIANAPAMAELVRKQKALEIEQQKQDFALTSSIKKVGTVGFLVLVAAALIGATGYTATRTTTDDPPVQRTSDALPGQTSPRQPPQPAVPARPNVQPAAANGHHDLRGSAYRQMIEENHAQTTRLAQQMATLAQQVGDTQATVQQILGSMQAQQAAIDQGVADLQTALHQHDVELRTLEARLAQHNGQGRHAIDVRETGGATGRHNGPHSREIVSPHSFGQRKVA